LGRGPDKEPGPSLGVVARLAEERAINSRRKTPATTSTSTTIRANPTAAAARSRRIATTVLFRCLMG